MQPFDIQKDIENNIKLLDDEMKISWEKTEKSITEVWKNHPEVSDEVKKQTLIVIKESWHKGYASGAENMCLMILKAFGIDYQTISKLSKLFSTAFDPKNN